MLIEHPDGDKYKHESELRKEDMAHAIDNFILKLGLLLWQIKTIIHHQMIYGQTNY